MSGFGGDPFRRLFPGQRLPFLPAQPWNEFLATRAAEQGRAHDEPAGSGDRKRERAQSAIVRVRNDTEATLARGHAIEITAPLIAPDDNEAEAVSVIALKGEAVTAKGEAGARGVAIAVEPIAAGEIGLAALAGVVMARVRVPLGLDEPSRCGAQDGETTLLAAASSGDCRIIWIEDSGEERWALVRLADPELAAFEARIGESVTAIEQHEKWEYEDWDEVEEAAGEAQVKSGGVSSTSTGKSARNRWEEVNSDNRENAESADPDPNGYEKSPELKRRLRVPEGEIVRMYRVIDVTTGEVEYRFTSPNPVQTYCPTTTQEPE